MGVPFNDLYAQYLSIRTEIDDAIRDTILHSSYIGGKSVRNFEEAFAGYSGIKNVIACANGTDSLEMILKAWGIGPGDEVIVPAHSWISTSECVGNVGAIPVFVDVEPDHFTIDVSRIEEAITARTKAIIPVHLYGHPADMPSIMGIALKHGLKVLEDCAQSHGAAIDGKQIGTFGDAASFSFYPGKNLGAYGDAGCMATNNEELAHSLRMLANHGQDGKHNHVIEGRNSRMDGLQAAILSAKMPHLEVWTDQRIAHAGRYNELIRSSEVKVPTTRQGYRHVFHLYVIRVREREAVMNMLTENNVETAIHYPRALPFLPCYADRGFLPTHFPVAFKNQSEILSLPLFPEMTDSQIGTVTSLIDAFQNVRAKG
jgi:dTDP-4-amino-4,6-dideoxygalactose transaminase